MRRLLAVLGLAALIQGHGLSDPRPVLACSCIPDVTFRDHVAAQPGGGLAVGRLVNDRGDGSFDLAVERWYGGQDRRPVVVVQSNEQRQGDSVTIDTCGLGLKVGQRMLFYGQPAADGRYTPSNCGIHADPTTAEGAAYEREARTVLGPAIAVTGSDPPDRPLSEAATVPLIAVVVAIGLGVVALFAVVVLVARRRDRRPT